MIPLISWSIRTWVTSSGSTCFLLYTYHCLCAMVRQKYRSTGHGAVGQQMGLKSSQMGGIVCVAWISFLGILGMWKEDMRLTSRKGCLVHPGIFYFLCQSVDFLLRSYFCLLPTFAKSLRELEINKIFINVYTQILKM